MIEANDIIKYILHSPTNTNPNVLKDLLVAFQNSGGEIDPELIEQAVAKYLEENPIEPTPIDTTLTKEGQAADAKAVGDALNLKATTQYVLDQIAQIQLEDLGNIETQTTTVESDQEASVIIEGNTFYFSIPKGEKGDKGEQGAIGPQGPAGEDGKGVTILGSYNTEEELREAHPTGSIGDSYLVEGDLYVWSETEADWKNVGNIEGPPGPQGPQGETAPLDSTLSQEGYAAEAKAVGDALAKTISVADLLILNGGNSIK